jgi:hypothetical protein
MDHWALGACLVHDLWQSDYRRPSLRYVTRTAAGAVSATVMPGQRSFVPKAWWYLALVTNAGEWPHSVSLRASS